MSEDQYQIDWYSGVRPIPIYCGVWGLTLSWVVTIHNLYEMMANVSCVHVD